MAVKFPLVMKDGEVTHSLTELRTHFDVPKIVEYYLDGTLKKWLDARYYEEEAAAVSQLTKDDPALAEKLCGIFGVPYTPKNAVDMEQLEKRKARLARLREYTDDEEILDDIDLVAFNQEELAELYDQGAEKVILCGGDFRVPKSKYGVGYILVGDVTINGAVPQKENTEQETGEEMKTNGPAFSPALSAVRWAKAHRPDELKFPSGGVLNVGVLAMGLGAKLADKEDDGVPANKAKENEPQINIFRIVN